MKTYNTYHIIIVLFSLCCVSCSSEEDISVQDRDKLLVYLQAGYHANVAITERGIVNEEIENVKNDISIIAKATRNVPSAINITIGVVEDSETIADYKTKTGNAYSILPKKAYKLGNTDFVIQAGQSTSLESLDIEWAANAKDYIEEGIYLLPLAVTGFNRGKTDAELSDNRTTIFVEVHFREINLAFKDVENRYVEIIEIAQDESAPAVIENNDVLFEVVLNHVVSVDVEASIIADNNLVDEYNDVNSTSYLTVPDQWYTISNGNLTISSGETTTEPTQVTFNSDASFESSGQYLLPLRLTSSSLTIEDNADRVYIILDAIYFDVYLAFNDVEDRNVEIVLARDESDPAVIENNDLMFEVVLNDEVEVDGEASIIADNNLVDEYNNVNATSYLTVPDQWYTISNGNLTISSSEVTTEPTQVTFNKNAGFEPGQYLLPLRLTSSSLTLEDNADRVYIILNVIENDTVGSENDNVGSENDNPLAERTKVDRSNWTIEVSSTTNLFDDYNKENLLDGDVGTGWLSDGMDTNVELILDAGVEITVEGFEFSLLSFFGALDINPTEIDIYSSADGMDWKHKGKFERDVPTELDDISRIPFYSPVITARYFRFEMTSSAGLVGISEINAVE